LLPVDYSINFTQDVILYILCPNHLELDSGHIITGCNELRYVESILTKDGRDTKNVHHRVTQAGKIISALNGVWWSKGVIKNWKKMIYNSTVRSVLMYGAET